MDILLAGSISYDYIMRYDGTFADLLNGQNSRVQIHFEVADMHHHHGGVSANIAYSLALLGGNPKLFGTVGKDFAPYRQRLDAVGVDTSTVIVVEEDLTATFFANTDQHTNQLGAFYAGAMRYADRYPIMERVAAAPDLVVISPNAPQAMHNQVLECQARGIAYIFDPSQQSIILDGEMLRQGIAGCMALTCNEYEWEVIQQKTGYEQSDLRDMGKVFVHTLGDQGATIFTENREITIPAIPAQEIVNPTGAGDAFRGGLLRGISLGLDWQLAGYMGALCGTYALEQHGTQAHAFSLPEFVARLRQHMDDGGALDALLGESSESI